VILLTRMEHHANIVPWQADRRTHRGDDQGRPRSRPDGVLDLGALHAAMTPDVKLLGVTHVSNVLGTINPIRDICREAGRRGIVTVVDGSQALPHMAVDIPSLGCDFYAFTGHKMCGPTGTGALWARREHLAAMPPFLGGGEMIKEVRFDGTVFNDPPHRFEAGTPNIAGHVGSVPRSITSMRSAWTRSPRARPPCSRTSPRRWGRSMACASSAPRRTRPRSCRSWSKAPTPTTWPPCWTWRAWPCVRATTARIR
jgi:selenocysteine lyase/cysteine desulfurase